MADLSLRGVSKAFDGHTVVRDVSFDIADGEFVVLVGPSGCGKSTLLRLIAGLEDVSAGEIRIGERVVNRLPAKDRDIAMVFQNYALYPHMTVAQNMGFSLQLRGQPREVIDRKVREAAATLGLEECLSRYPRQLSGGQRQRVAMGRAIVRAPKVFLFDEPLSNLDAQLRVQMRTEIKALHQRLATTTVYVTHDQTEAMTMGDRVVVLRGGCVEQSGRPLDVYDRPANLFVAGFVGSPAMNTFEGVVEHNDGDRVCRLPSGARWPMPSHVRVDAGQEIVFAVRPEHIRLVEKDGLAGRSTGGVVEASAVVVAVEPTGSETQLAVRLEGVDASLLVRHRVRVRAGDRIDCVLDPSHAHVFDRRTGRRLNTDG